MSSSSSSVLMSAAVCWNYSHEINAVRDRAWLRINCSLLGWGAFIAIHAQITLIATTGLIHLTTRVSRLLWAPAHPSWQLDKFEQNSVNLKLLIWRWVELLFFVARLWRSIQINSNLNAHLANLKLALITSSLEPYVLWDESSVYIRQVYKKP
jgi:hypothetical protein